MTDLFLLTYSGSIGNVKVTWRLRLECVYATLLSDVIKPRREVRRHDSTSLRNGDVVSERNEDVQRVILIRFINVFLTNLF